MTNRLSEETSPYLLQHQHNPIDWFPWGDEAIECARALDRPIFLSVGYAACHWCHVMERESFEHEAIAQVLNDHFVAIKVDREERPDVDSIYMDAVQLMSGQGGWPMSVWLDHELRPFFAGTYFPPEDKWGKPGFLNLLNELKDVWLNERERIDAFGVEMLERLEAMARPLQMEKSHLEPDALIERMISRNLSDFDPKHGGFGRAPKFPPGDKLRAIMQLLDLSLITEDQHMDLEDVLETTLVHMASGAMYDQIGGGFHRYSTDEKWLIPHFEKMLYDNASLLMSYVLRFEQTGHPFYARIAQETATYLRREMTDKTGAFWSSQDADSEGEEGKFFVWTPQTVEQTLTPQDARLACAYWGIGALGNFEHGTSAPSRLHTVGDALGLATVLGEGVLAPEVQRWKSTLLDTRSQRIWPETDTKIIAAWNGLTIRALARAGATLGQQPWIDAAIQAATHMIGQMTERREDEHLQLFRIYKDGRRRFEAYLEDYAAMALGMIALFEATAQAQWLEYAQDLIHTMILDFGDEDGTFFTTTTQHKDLIVRQKDTFDGAMASGQGMALEASLLLWGWIGDDALRDRVDRGLNTLHTMISRHPTNCATLFRVWDMHRRGQHHLIGVVPGAAMDQLKQMHRVWRPNMSRVLVTEAQAVELAEFVPMIAHKTMGEENTPMFYLCHEGVCQRPVSDCVDLMDYAPGA